METQMKTALNDYLQDSKFSRWQFIGESIRAKENIDGIEGETIFVYTPTLTITLINFEKGSGRISRLRGKLSKQNNSEIDDQISGLRNEWDRDI